MLEGRMAIQMVLDRVEELANRDRTKFKTNKCQILQLRRKSP